MSAKPNPSADFETVALLALSVESKIMRYDPDLAHRVYRHIVEGSGFYVAPDGDACLAPPKSRKKVRAPKGARGHLQLVHSRP